MQTTEKFPEVESKWDSITNALDPYNTKPSLDPDSQYMVPRPETAELDGVIQNIEEQLGELQACPVLLTLCKFLAILCVCVCVSQEAFSDQWFLLERLTAREREAGLAKNVMETIDSQVKDMLVNILIGSIWS